MQKAEADDENPSLDNIAEEAARRREAVERRRAEENREGAAPAWRARFLPMQLPSLGKLRDINIGLLGRQLSIHAALL